MVNAPLIRGCPNLILPSRCVFIARVFASADTLLTYNYRQVEAHSRSASA